MKKGVIIVFVATLAFAASACSAAIITIAIEGVVDTINDPCDLLGGQVSPSDIITGTYSYDTTVPDTSTNPNTARWVQDGFGTEMVLHIGTFTFKSLSDYRLAISNNSYNQDGYAVISSWNYPVETIPIDRIGWYLNDNTQAANANLDLPLDAPVLSDWDYNYLVIDGVIDCEQFFSIEGHITSATLVPEPLTITIMFVGSLLTRCRKYQ